MRCDIIKGDCEEYLKQASAEVFDLTFLDPPFNQGKDYNSHNDKMPPPEYWAWMERVCKLIYDHTSAGGAIYFMQREKNTQSVLDCLHKTGWNFHNLIIWQKKTSAVPIEKGFGKHYQIIAYFTKGKKPRLFNKLRINPPLLVTEKYERKTGLFVTDVWNDIRELTSGYFAGQEPFRTSGGQRLHKQQSPVQLLLRIILSSSKINDTVFDPFAGTGTTLVVAKQLMRNAVGIEIDESYINLIKQRFSMLRASDDILKYREDYLFTENLDEIWSVDYKQKKSAVEAQKTRTKGYIKKGEENSQFMQYRIFDRSHLKKG
jgi:DNA modification methylase